MIAKAMQFSTSGRDMEMDTGKGEKLNVVFCTTLSILVCFLMCPYHQ